VEGRISDATFDRVARRFGAVASRRATLLGVAAGLAATAAGVGLDAQAKKKQCDKKTKKKCAKRDLGCDKGKCVVTCNTRNSQCQGKILHICGDDEADHCVCSPLAEDGFTCAAQRPEVCPVASQCDRDTDCKKGEVCVDASSDNCCGSPGFGLCLDKCKNEPPKGL
jgi:hypothetical protein